ncbi:MAG: hypothetical protein ACJAZO_000700 [Myxococcota bacterium]|jgi:hypothetical protein
MPSQGMLERYLIQPICLGPHVVHAQLPVYKACFQAAYKLAFVQ